MTTAVSEIGERQARFTRSMTQQDRRTARNTLRALGHTMSRSSVMQFQRGAHIKVDGIIGPQTRGALLEHMAARDRSHVDPNLRIEGARQAPMYQGGRTARDATPRPDGMIPAGELQSRDAERRVQNLTGTPNQPLTGNQKFDFYANIVRQHGGVVNPNGQATVLGVRMRDGATKQFQDRIVVLSPNGNVSEFAASTRPSSGATELVPGNYRVTPHGPHNGAPSYQVLNMNGRDGVPVYRDSRQSRIYHNGTGILFHVPKPWVHDSQPTSIGCINIRRADWGRFMAAVGGNRDFNFTLINR